MEHDVVPLPEIDNISHLSLLINSRVDQTASDTQYVIE